MGLWAAAAVQLRRSARHAQMRTQRAGRVASTLIYASLGTLERDASHAARGAARLIAQAERRGRRLKKGLSRSLQVVGRLVRYHVPGERRTCPACGSPRVRLLQPMLMRRRPDEPSVGFVAGCQACGVIFANPFPTAAQLAAFYSPQGEWGQARATEEKEGKAPPPPDVLRMFAGAQVWIDLTKPPADGAVLDFGCGSGRFLDVLREFGWRTCGIDPGDKRAFPRHSELTDVPRTPTFDVVILYHVLEHVERPLEILRGVHESLRPGGVVLVSVPRLDTLPLHRDYRYCINTHNHVVAYSHDCMATLFALAGFDSLDVSAPPDAGIADRFGLRRLRMIGRKDALPAPPPRPPLPAAERALAQYFREHEKTARWRAALPVRTRAALADLDRGRRLS